MESLSRRTQVQSIIMVTTMNFTRVLKIGQCSVSVSELQYDCDIATLNSFSYNFTGALYPLVFNKDNNLFLSRRSERSVVVAIVHIRSCSKDTWKNLDNYSKI